jgi:hypothetical protein
MSRGINSFKVHNEFHRILLDMLDKAALGSKVKVKAVFKPTASRSWCQASIWDSAANSSFPPLEIILLFVDFSVW